MAQTFNTRILGGIEVKAEVEYKVSDILAISTFSTATFLILKSRFPKNDPIRISVNKTVAIPFDYNEHQAIKSSFGTDTFVFTKDCFVAVAQEVTA